jgi:hypothetical protein
MTTTQKIAGFFMTTIMIALIVNQVINNFNFSM